MGVTLGEGIRLYVLPGATGRYTWPGFQRAHGPYAVALDGIVNHARIFAPGPYANFDHHYGCVRLSTLATCEQVHEDLRSGAFWQRGFLDDKLRPKANVFFDLDEDTLLATFLFKNHEFVTNPVQFPDMNINSLRDFVRAEGVIDRYSGVYDIKDDEMYGHMSWMFNPFHQARFSNPKALEDKSYAQTIIRKVHRRMMRYTKGSGESIDNTGDRFKTLRRGKKWVIIEETGPGSRLAVSRHFSGEPVAFIFYKGMKGDGHVWSYADSAGILRGHEFHKEMNELEGDWVSSDDHWGGSRITGGSAPGVGSSIDLDLMSKKLGPYIRRK